MVTDLPGESRMLLKKLPHAFMSSFLSAMLVTQTVLSQSALAQSANVSDQIKFFTTNRTFIQTGNTLFETDDLAQFYGLRNNLPVWTKQGGAATAFALALKGAIGTLSANHGLIASDYWTVELEAYLNGLDTTNAMAFETAATHSLIQLANHLSNGRIDPASIDNDVRFKRRAFADHLVVAQSVSGTPGMIADILETLAPQHRYYKNAVQILAQLRLIKDSGGFQPLKKSSITIKLGKKNKAVPVVRERLKQYGYTFVGTDDTYDQELSAAVQEFQTEHGFEVSPDLKPDSGFWGVMNTSVDQRIAQTEATLEKLRWLPKELEANMIFVNTNATEVKVWENNQVVNQFRSINGRVLRRTPMMKTWITRVIFNPRWTATDSIVLQDKLPEIQKNPAYLDSVRMKMFSRRGGEQVDPTTLDWIRNGHSIARNHVFVMDPGPKNALGTFKFPLVPDTSDPTRSNSDDIFMHFTDDPRLFAKPSARHMSSGCIRLEKAQWLAGFLLKNVPGYDDASIQNLIAKGVEGEVFQTDKSVMLAPEDYRAVYTIPLTVEKTKSGRARFMKDSYLHDRRIQNAVMSSSLRMSVEKNKQMVTGGAGIKVIGQAGMTQQFGEVVAIRCDEPEFGSHARTGMRTINRRCESPIRFSLNSIKSLNTGRYILAFENSIYPGFVDVLENQVTTIQLQKISVPSSFGQQRNIKIFRDLSSQIEQKKMYFEKFYYGKNIFRQTIRKFGDFYLAGLTDIDTAPQTNYAYCSENAIDQLRLVSDIREHAKFVCETYNQATTFMDYADLYRFNSNGTAQEAAADYPGDVIPKMHLRYLVATPMTANDFVSVMPGAYRIASESGQSTRATTAKITENYSQQTRTFANSQNRGESDDIDLATTVSAPGSASLISVTASASATVGQCTEARVWRTEKRSYCTSDSLDGCNRALAQQCEEMKLDLRFRK